MASKASSSLVLNGRRKRSRSCTVTRLPPSLRAVASTAATDGRSYSNRLSLPGLPSDSAPMPANRSAVRAASPSHAVTPARMTSSARLVACRNAPGGGSIVTSPRISCGVRRTITGSAVARSPQLTRAMSALSASAISVSRIASVNSNFLCGRISTSSPVSVSLTTASADVPSRRMALIANRNAAIAVLIFGRATTQVPTSTTF